MEKTARNNGKPAAYGRACVNCARVKRKCMLRANGDGCERCFRLKVECNPSHTVRRSGSRPNGSQAARLEQKLDGLVSLLKARQGSLEPEETASSSGSFISAPSRASVPADRRSHAQPVVGDLDRATTDHGNKYPNNPSESGGLFPHSLSEAPNPSSHDAKQRFKTFYKHYTEFLPLLYFENGSTSEALYRESPFLWLCIMAVTSTYAKEQSSLAKKVREVAAREVIVEGKCTMDLLHGLLCFIGWGHFRFSMGSLLTILSQLCTALTVDLELRSRHSEESNLNHMFPRPIASQIQGATDRFQPRSIVKARTALACYFLTSCVATFQTVGESLAWSPYLEECLKMLQGSKCVGGDELLVHMIKLQRITSKVTDVRMQLRDNDSEQSTRLIYPYIFALNTQLSETRKQLPLHLATNKMLEAMSLHTEIYINDLIFTRLGHCPLLDDISSMEALLNCLNAAKRAVDIMFNFKPTEYTYFPFFLWRQFRTVILTLIRLASFEDPAWDVKMVRQTVDIASILDKTAENLSNVPTNVDDGIADPENVVSKSLAWVNRMRSALLAVYGQSTDAQAATSEMQSSMGIPGVEPLLPRQQSQEVASTIDIFSSLDHELFGDDVFGWWPPLYSENGP